ncbi:MAG: LacI family DNA-binding transcriptional regulator [Anaerolineae bacterium]|nr:LacI family DNA-binding transcriptional regulator [Anaerolineae bacterium]
MPTLKEVAQRANVSTATVSKVLSNTPYVSEATRERVLEAVEELGYIPNLAARALSKGRTYVVGVIYPYHYTVFSDPLLLAVIEGIESVCTERGYNMLISTPRIPVSDAEPFQRLIRSGYLDGAVVFETLPKELVSAPLHQFGYPWVAIGYHAALGQSNIIRPDDEGGAKSIARHLISLGHRQFGIIGVDPGDHSAAEPRLAGYRAAFEEAGLDFNAVPHVYGNFTGNSGYQGAQALLNLQPRPTALLCMNDRMAIGAIQWAQEAGLRIPDDLSVVGFDDISDAQHSHPPMTTVRQPAGEIGAKAATLLFDLISQQHGDSQRSKQPQNYPQGSTPIIFPTELVIRESSGQVK